MVKNNIKECVEQIFTCEKYSYILKDKWLYMQPFHTWLKSTNDRFEYNIHIQNIKLYI
jgi:hypothetical protein